MSVVVSNLRQEHVVNEHRLHRQQSGSPGGDVAPAGSSPRDRRLHRRRFGAVRVLMRALTCGCALYACADPDRFTVVPWTDPTLDASVSPWPVPRDVDSPARDARFGDRSQAIENRAPDPTLEIFDPASVYAIGAVSDTPDSARAIISLSDPAQAVVGLDSNSALRAAKVRPLDGRIVYGTVDGDLRVFRSDGASYHPRLDPMHQPVDPGANDEVLAAPQCAYRRGTVDDLEIAPDGAIFYHCRSDWYDLDGEPLGAVLPSEGVDLFSVGETTILHDEGLVNRATLEVTPLKGLPSVPSETTVRRRDDGYWVALSNQLWHVDLDGKATLLGTYASPSQEVTAERLPQVLDGEGRLYWVAKASHGLFQRVVIRSTVGGESTVIYDERDAPGLKLSEAVLVTGP